MAFISYVLEEAAVLYRKDENFASIVCPDKESPVVILILVATRGIKDSLSKATSL